MGARVLLVEDEALIRLLMAEVLLDAGFEVVEAPSGDEAAKLLDRSERFDLLLTDIHMPGELDGVALAEEARRHLPGLPVVYVTGRPDVMERIGRLGPGDAFLRKPYAPSEVVSAVRGLLPPKRCDA